MTMTTTETNPIAANAETAAYVSGYNDGETRVQDAEISGEFRETTATEEVDSWFRPGQEEADTALINACTGSMLAEALGISEGEAADSEGDALRYALGQYNNGFEAGARAAAAAHDGPETEGR
jgi:hypothetical protein